MAARTTRGAPKQAAPPAARATAPSHDDALAAVLASLSDLDLDTLRQLWRRRLGGKPPAHLPRSLLSRLLAYRLQAQAHGDLTPETARVLDRLAREEVQARQGAAGQAFNTTSSMGRLTLNVLLSFAQFEREVTAERIRDKVASSKQKGLWMGGVVPLGYAARDRALQIVPEHGALVRELFQRYLALGSVGALQAALAREGVRVPERLDGKGQRRGGGCFSRGQLHKLLTNPVYKGEVAHKGQRHRGQHQAVVDPALFQAVQDRLSAQHRAHSQQRHASGALLQGRILDDAGHPMSPSHASKGGVRYRYYVSQALLQGRREQAGSAPRVPAPEVEQAVMGALRARPGLVPGLGERELIERWVTQVVVRPGTLEVSLRAEGNHTDSRSPEPPLVVPWRPTPSRVRRQVIAPGDQDGAGAGRAGRGRVRPIRSEARARLLAAIARARVWVEELASGKVAGTEALALREGLSERGVRQQLGLAFLAPDIVEAALSGTLPRGLGLSRMLDLPPCWQAQKQTLGITSPQR